MTPWLWECFEEYFNRVGFEISDPGHVVGPAREVSIRRLGDGELELTAVSARHMSLRDGGFAPGSMRVLTEQARFGSRSGYEAIAEAVYLRSQSNESDPGDWQRHTAQYYVGRIFIARPSPPAVAFTIDWLSNVDRETCHWLGGAINDHVDATETRTIGDPLSGITLVRAGNGGLQSSYSAALEMVIGGVRVFLCASREGPKDHWPGYILYEGAPDEDFRRRVREVVGFTLGSGLIWWGSTALDRDSQFVWTCALSTSSYGRYRFEPADPPAPLSRRMENAVEQAEAGRVASALFEHYDEMDFRALSWNYWFAVNAPGHMAAGHFGAAIEALGEAYLSANPGFKLSGPIKDRREAKSVREALKKCLYSFNLNDAAAQQLAARIDQINRPNGRSTRQQLMERLGLGWGPAEDAAWRRRDAAAHGAARRPEDSIPTARDTVILRTILNRMVLKIAEASPTYIDRYTVGYRVRALSQAIDVDDPMGGK